MKKSGGWLGGCLLILLFILGVIGLILLAILWEYPGESFLGDMLWTMAKVPFIIGMVFAPSGFAISGGEKQRSSGCTVPVTAVIAEVIEAVHVGESRSSYKTYTPVYRYTLNGETISVKGRNYSTGTNKYQVGRPVQMFVQPGEPAKYCIPADTKKTLLVGRIMGGVGIGFFVIGAGMWLFSIALFILGL